MSDNAFVIDEVKQEPINFATVTGVYEDGLTLRLDGEDVSTQKRYKCNSFVIFRVGDRVRILKDSGTYVVEYSIGNPKTIFDVDISKNVSDTINGKPIKDIFEADGIKVKSSSASELSYGLVDYKSNEYGIWFRLSGGYIQIYHAYKGKWVNIVAY